MKDQPDSQRTPEVPTRRPILIVDDSRAQRRLLTHLLERWGRDVRAVASGAEALELLGRERIDLVITDWMMPGMDGPTLCRAFRASRGRTPGYIIMLTAKSDRDQVAEGLEAGADDFLTKPVHPAELRARLRTGQRILDTQRAVTSKNRLLNRALGDLKATHDALQRDLEEARKLQAALVPRTRIGVEGGEVSLLFRPSGKIGGDLVGVIPVSPSRLGVFSLDVAGHGIASALLVARVAGYLMPTTAEHNIALRDGGDGPDLRPPSEICARLNDLIASDTGAEHYLTMLFADCDLATGRCRIAQAGHPSPLLQTADGAVSFPAAFGMPIGLIEEADYEDHEITLAPGDRLLLFSDGVTECADGDGCQLDEEGLARLVGGLTGVRGTAFTDRLCLALEHHAGSDRFEDDVSAALIERA